MPEDAAPVFSDETLMAWVDGELDPDEAARVAAAIAADGTLAARARLFERTRGLAREALAGEGAAPVSEALRAAVERTAAGAGRPARRAAPARSGSAPGPARRARTAGWMALAACLAGIAAGLGGYLAGARGPAPAGATISVGTTLPPALAAILRDRPSGSAAAIEGDATLRLVASFRDASGALCREFDLARPAGTTTAVTCLRDGDFRLLFAVAGGSGGTGYAPAAASEAVETFLAGLEAGAVLSPEAERAALAAIGDAAPDGGE